MPQKSKCNTTKSLLMPSSLQLHYIIGQQTFSLRKLCAFYEAKAAAPILVGELSILCCVHFRASNENWAAAQWDILE